MRVVVSGNVWLPIDELSGQQIVNIKDSLTIYPKKTTDIATKADPPPIYMYDECENTLGVPRAWYRKNVSKKHDEEIKVSYGGKMSDLTTRYKATGNFIEQEAVIRTFLARMEGKEWDGFLLKAGCAFGKTATSLEFARRVGRRTLVIVHKEFFLKQWKRRIKFFMPDAKVGIIRQNKCEFEDCDFVIAMLQSLVRDKDSKKYPQRIYDHEFGMVINDECHRIAASSWSSVLPRFNAAWRLGLTATPRRKDGAQDVFFNHISDITYSAKTKAQVPGLRVLKTHSYLRPIRRGNYCVSVDALNSAQILTQLGNDQFRAKDIVDQLVLAVQNGRKIMVVSERLSHLKLMSDMLMNSLFSLDLPFEPVIDFCTGEWFSGEVWKESNKRHKKGDPKMVKRTEADFDKAERANVIFATKQVCVDGDSIVIDAITGFPFHIKDISEKICHDDVRLLSYDENNNIFYPNRVIASHDNGKAKVRDIFIGKGEIKFSVTDDHKVLTFRGWLKAEDIIVGDLVKLPNIDKILKKWVSDDGIWERVCKIEDGRICRVYDLTMEKDHNFVCDGVLVHNCEEGLDIEALDVLVLSMPMGDVEQIVGRVRRWCFQDKEKCEHYCPWRAGKCKEKPMPIVVDVVDEDIPQLLPKWRRRQKFYRSIGTEVP